MKLALKMVFEKTCLHPSARDEKAKAAATDQILTTCLFGLPRMTNAFISDELHSRKKQILREHIHDLAASVIT
jgi:hypothetical protein